MIRALAIAGVLLAALAVPAAPAAAAEAEDPPGAAPPSTTDTAPDAQADAAPDDATAPPAEPIAGDRARESAPGKATGGTSVAAPALADSHDDTAVVPGAATEGDDLETLSLEDLENEEPLGNDLGSQLDPRPPSLSLYGFSDFTVSRYWMPEDSASQALVSRFANFRMGRVNLYLRSEPAPSFTSLIEFRLMYLPDGGLAEFTTLDPVDTAVLDTSDLGAVVDWGGISIQRAWLQYDFNRYFSVRAGHFLTPYGIWNIDHGSPIITPVRRPFVITQELFPESQVGLQVLGSVDFHDFQLGYRATVGNSDNPFFTSRDFQDDKALGGRLELVTPWLDELTLGVSAYGGRFTVRELEVADVGSGSPSDVTLESVVTSSGNRLSLGADLRLKWRGVEVTAEFLDRQQVYDDDARTKNPVTGGPRADYRDFGGYVIAGYRFAWQGAMPFVQYEHLRAGSGNLEVNVGGAGVNLRLHPTVTLKAVFSRGWLDDYDGAAAFATDNLTSIETQVAWVF